MSAQELHTLTGLKVIGRSFELLTPKSVQRFTWPDASALFVDCGFGGFSCELRAEYLLRLTNKQGPGFLGAPLPVSEPKLHPYANKPTLNQAQRSSDPCKMEKEMGSFRGPESHHESRRLTTWDTPTEAIDPDTSRRYC